MAQSCNFKHAASFNESSDDVFQDIVKSQCVNGLIVPVWGDAQHLSTAQRLLRGLFYLLIMCYLFVGISVISDK